MTASALFRWSAATALAAHALALLASDGLYGGGDLKPHLRLIQLMGEEPALRSVYAPAYHVVGALAAPLTGLAAYPEWFGWLSLAGLIGAFRLFQRSVGLPDEAAALFAWMPYHFALTGCLPKIEAAGYALALVGLSLLWRRRHALAALCLAATFAVHTAAALFLGLTGGVLALALRDPRGLIALAAGAALALPLPIAHLHAGCTPAQALLFSQGDYLRAAPRATHLEHWDRILLLANPLALLAAGLGARQLWRSHRPVAIVCALVALVYLNEAWLAPFGARTTLDLLRGLSLLAIPVAAAGGCALALRRGPATAVVAASALLSLAAAAQVVPRACVSKPIDIAEIASFDVDRCTFRWRRRARAPGLGSRPEATQVGPDRRVERTAPLQRPAQ
jgi:hypothetical protein